MKLHMLVVSCMLGTAGLYASEIMYGVNGGHASTVTPPNGDLVIVDQATGAVTPLGASGFPRLTGLGIEPNGTFYASTLGGVPFPPGPGQHSTSDLLKLSASGAVLSDLGTIATAAGGAVAIADLAVQPGTGTLYAFSNEFGAVPPGGLYTINPATATATLVAQTNLFFGSIAFAPNGSLYLIGASFNNGPVNPLLERLNPSTGATIGTSVTLSDYYGAFGIRPSDSLFFVSNGDGANILTLNPTTGVATLLPSSTGANLVADLDFATPEPGSLVAVGLGFALLLAGSRRGRRKDQRHVDGVI